MRRKPGILLIFRNSAKTNSSSCGVFWDSICLNARHSRSGPAFKYQWFTYCRRDQFHRLDYYGGSLTHVKSGGLLWVVCLRETTVERRLILIHVHK